MLGLFFQDAIETKLRNLYIVTTVLALFAVILGRIDRGSAHTKYLDRMALGDGVLMGFGQAMILIPGVSRSGGTVIVGLPLGYTREAAARVSFLLTIPAVTLPSFFQFAKSFDITSLAAGPIILTTIVSFAVGYAVTMWFLKLVSMRSYMPFVAYRITLAVIVAGLLVGGVVCAY